VRRLCHGQGLTADAGPRSGGPAVLCCAGLSGEAACANSQEICKIFTNSTQKKLFFKVGRLQKSRKWRKAESRRSSGSNMS
jgi:hypothetical protein